MSNIGNRTTFSNNLKHYMKLKGKTRKQICSDLDFSYSTFSEWVLGKKYPRIDKIEMLANYFGIEKSDLIEDKLNKEYVENANNEAVLKLQKRWNEEVKENNFSDDEMTQLINFAKYLISQRGQRGGKK